MTEFAALLFLNSGTFVMGDQLLVAAFPERSGRREGYWISMR